MLQPVCTRLFRHAAECVRVEVMKALLAAGADVTVQDNYTIHSTAEGGHVEILETTKG